MTLLVDPMRDKIVKPHHKVEDSVLVRFITGSTTFTAADPIIQDMDDKKTSLYKDTMCYDTSFDALITK